MDKPSPAPRSLVLATRNAHKVAEIAALLGGQARCLSLKEFPAAPGVVEDAPTFAGNAAKKAVALAQWLAAQPAPADAPLGAHWWVLADDSGLEVDALGGAPGVHSARFAALETGATGNASDAANNAKLLTLLAAIPAAQRTARFRCALALAPVAPDAAGRLRAFDGACEGTIGFAPRGGQGFGYDPLFVPEGFTESFAELGEEVKNRISHRARALARLQAALPLA